MGHEVLIKHAAAADGFYLCLEEGFERQEGCGKSQGKTGIK